MEDVIFKVVGYRDMKDDEIQVDSIKINNT